MRWFALALPLLLAADWPQFLGPTRDSASPEKVAAWKEAPAVAWRAPLGDAHSSPVVANGLVYAFYQPAKKNADALAAFDAATGAKKWEKSYERAAYTPPFGKGPRSTPAVAGGKVFTLGNTGILAAWDAAKGDLLWKVDTLAEFKHDNLFFGVSTSPLVEGNTVVVMVGGKGHGVVAFDAATGKTAWQALDDNASYSSPLAIGSGATRQLVFLTGANLVALSPEGKTLWSVPFKDRLNESSTTPVKVGDLLVGSSVTAGSIALKLGEVPPEKVWAKKELTCYFSTPVAVKKHLYMVTGAATLTNASVSLRCVDPASGKILWQQKDMGRYHAALLRTGDDRLLMLDDNGGLTLFAADEAKFTVLAKSKVCGPTWAHPALVGGTLYLRDEKELIALTLP